MRLSTYNVENLFDRVKAMNLSSWAQGKPILDDYARLNDLINQPVYTNAIKDELLTIMQRHSGLLTQGESTYIQIIEVRGKLITKSGNQRIIAKNGRNDWVGWFELKTEPIKHAATDNIANIIGLLNTDILCVIEAEDRPGLKLFNKEILTLVNVTPFDHVMLIDGNDDRGIDVGILTKAGYEIVRITTHSDDKDAVGIIFSRDCADYEIKTPNNNTLILLINHLKSKGYGSQADSNAKRLRQATRVREIYDGYINKGYQYVAVLGDFNENPGNPPLDPLLRSGSTLKDTFTHSQFVNPENRPGTHGNCAKSGRLDYILLSPALWNKVQACGVERRGIWAGANGTLFPHIPQINTPTDAASDHAALWVDLNI